MDVTTRWIADLFLCGMLSGVLSGCGGSQDLNKQYNEAKAMSLLKQYATAQALYQTETSGEYGTLEKLHAGSGYIQDELYNAWDGNAKPIPVGGYLFSELGKSDTGDDLDPSERAGLAAHPVEPGVSGDKIILMLLDLTDTREPQQGYEEGSFSSLGEDWNYYVADYNRIGNPVTRWPSKSDLESKWTKLEKRSPQEALKAAKRMAAQVKQ